MIRPILTYGNPILREKCADVAAITDTERAILDDMADTMHAHSCVGFSAPQIGEKQRLFVIDVAGVSIRGANPEIISAGALSEDIEGSPCIPGIRKPVRRPSKIICRYLDESGEIVERELKGVPARAFCHEKDHHDGMLFIDHLKPIQLKLIQRDLDRIANNTLKGLEGQ
ncbi:MAG TPA: peptide deformylase [Methanocorpusculum sp.]|nr:peptide deformylase [Methanocorpusculum sp.]